jgi:hypothetical protein
MKIINSYLKNTERFTILNAYRIIACTDDWGRRRCCDADFGKPALGHLKNPPAVISGAMVDEAVAKN